MCHATPNQTICRVVGCTLPIAIDEKRGVRHGYCSVKCARASGETIRADRYALQAEREQKASIKAKAAMNPKPAAKEAPVLISYFKAMAEKVEEAEDRKRNIKAKEEEDRKRKNGAREEKARKLEHEAKEKEALRLESEAKASTGNSTQHVQGPTLPQLREQQNETREFTPVRLVLTPEAVSEDDMVVVRSTSRCI